MATTSGMAEQYADSRKLRARARLHEHYTIAAEPWFTWVASRLGLQSGQAVLDLGCGPGWFWVASADVAPPGLHLTLADLSPGMIEEAVNRCRPLPFASVEGKPCDATSLPFASESFDVVIAMHMLYHVRDQQAALAEIHRVLKPGGTLGVTTNGIGNLREIYELTTVFGSAPTDPAAQYFGYDRAAELMQAQFGAVEFAEHPAHLEVTDPEDVFMALTSYPPGDGAPEGQLAQFRAAIDAAFRSGSGTLKVHKQSGLFLSHKH